MFRIKGLLTIVFTFAFVAAAFAQDEAPEDPGTAELTLNGKKITITFGRPSTDGPGYKSMERGVPAGYQWRMGRNEPTQLDTEADLKFGDTTIKAGTYGLWAKRGETGWDLVISNQVILPNAPEAKESIVAVVPLKHNNKLEKPVKWMLIELKEDKDAKNGGIFRLAWGPEEGTAKFTLAE